MVAASLSVASDLAFQQHPARNWAVAVASAALISVHGLSSGKNTQIYENFTFMNPDLLM